MHQSSFNKMSQLLEKYVPSNVKVLDVGATNHIWNYKEAVLTNNDFYMTLDWGIGADYIVNSYDWDHIPKNMFDVVITGQAFEHDKFFWKTTENIKNILSPGSIVIIIVPSCGHIHRYPVDCYRFYPDSAETFAEILNADILEVDYNTESEWGDLAMVFKLK